MIGRSLLAFKTGFAVVLNALGLMALFAAAWLLPHVLDLMVRVS